MRALLVTSEVTYVPRNYTDLFEELLEGASEHIAGLVILENLSWKLGRDIAGLALMGCRGVSASLLRNIVTLRKRSREALFEARGLPVLRARSMNDPQMIHWVREQGIDLVVNLRTRCIYKKEILSAPRLGCINVHHGILPTYRGTLCDLYALHEGRAAGFTIHEMTEKLDAGRILLKKEVSQPGERDYLAYLQRTGVSEGRALAELLKEIAANGELPQGELNHSEQVVFTRNPSRGKIQEMRNAGMAL